MKPQEWFLCPSNNCQATLDIEAVTYWDIVMSCPKCSARVILKRYISGNFNDILAQHSDLSEKQREYLNGSVADKLKKEIIDETDKISHL